MEPTSDDIPSESTPLVNSTALEVGESNVDDSTEHTSSPDLEAGNAFNQFEESELEKPWPATFERSISLLAGPISDTDFIEQITKSPKITPNIGARRKQNEFNTPDMGPGMLRPQSSFKQGIVKVQSLDFGAGMKKESDAHAYRMTLLEAQKKKKKQDQPTSKVGEDLRKKKEQQDSGGHGHGLPDSGEKASFGQCIFNMANILMGVGMLGLPYIFKSAGWIGGAFVTVFFSSVAYRTSILLGRELNGDARPIALFFDTKNAPSRMRKPINSFPAIAREAFGKCGTILLSSVLYFELFSCLAIFFVTLGDHLHTLFPQISVTQHMIHVSFALAVPTALLRTPTLLSYLSAVGTVATAGVVSAVAGSAIYFGDISESVAERKHIDMSNTPTHEYWEPSGLAIAFGLIAYTFSGHAIIPSIYSSIKKPQEYESMIGFTFTVVTFCCLIVAVSGYWMFGSLVDDQITLSLEKNSGDGNILMKVLTWLMILTAFSKFTLTAFPLALGFEEIIAPCLPSDRWMDFLSSIIKLLLIAAALAVAVFVPSFSVLCSLVGLICTMIVSVIFPAAAHLKLFGPQLSLWDKFLDWTFVLLGTFMAVIGTISST